MDMVYQTNKSSEKIELPESKATFILGIISIAIACIPYVGATAFIMALIGLKHYKVSYFYYRTNKKKYTVQSVVFQFVGLYLSVLALIVSAIYFSIIPFYLVAFGLFSI